MAIRMVVATMVLAPAASRSRSRISSIRTLVVVMVVAAARMAMVVVAVVARTPAEVVNSSSNHHAIRSNSNPQMARPQTGPADPSTHH